MERDVNPEVSEGREVSVRGGTKYSQEEDPDLKEKEAVEKDQAKLGQVEGSDAVNMVMTEGAMEGDLNTTGKARGAMEDEVTPGNKTKKKKPNRDHQRRSAPEGNQCNPEERAREGRMCMAKER